MLKHISINSVPTYCEAVHLVTML